MKTKTLALALASFLLSPRLPELTAEEARAPEQTLVVRPEESIALLLPEGGSVVEAALDGGLLRAVGTSIRAPASGDHWLAMASRDSMGNLSEPRWVLLRVDPDPPEVVLQVEPAPVPDPQARLWVPPGAVARAVAKDSVAGVARLILEAGGERATAETGAASLPLPGSGDVAVLAGATDRVGNASAQQRIDLSVDGEAPSGRLRIVGPQAAVEAGLVAGPSARVEASITDSGSGLDRWIPRLDAEEVDEARWAPPWTAGPHSAEAFAVDRVRNQAVLGPLAFVIDAEGPEIRWEIRQPGISDGQGLRFYRPPVLVEVRVEDAPAGLARLEWSQDGQAFEPAGPVLRSATTGILLRATDRVENTAELRVDWRLDADPPELALQAPVQGSVAADNSILLIEGESVRVLATDAGCGVERVGYSVDRGGWEDLPEGFRFPVAGRYTLHAEAADRLGNTARASWSVRVRKLQEAP